MTSDITTKFDPRQCEHFKLSNKHDLIAHALIDYITSAENEPKNKAGADNIIKFLQSCNEGEITLSTISFIIMNAVDDKNITLTECGRCQDKKDELSRYWGIFKVLNNNDDVLIIAIEAMGTIFNCFSRDLHVYNPRFSQGSKRVKKKRPHNHKKDFYTV